MPGPGAVVEESAARLALARVLESSAFANVDRLKRFLRFISEQTLAGHGDQLKEFLIAKAPFRIAQAQSLFQVIPARRLSPHGLKYVQEQDPA